jgi:signal transduction histidine kinase/CheY-like chemotaxis protein
MADSSTGSAVGYRDDAAVAALLRERETHVAERDPRAERAALAGLAQHLADEPERLLQRVAEAVRELCAADSVVIAVREAGADGEEVCWNAVAGDLAGHEGKRWPLRACPCGASVLADGAVLFARPASEFESIRASGVRASEAIGVPWRLRGRAAGALVAVLGGDGQHFDADDLQLLRDLAGFAAAAHLSREISVRKRTEDALRESEARFRALAGALKDADRRKDEFLATLAHELRNPLAPISNAVQLLRRPDGRRQSDRVIEMVGRQVRQIVRLVDDLMEVSRITRGKIDLKLERVPVAEIIHGAVETSQPAVDRAGHRLDVTLPGEPLVLMADRLRLTQVFANLLNNAAKYTDEGGRIQVDVWREDGAMLASVRDTGIGIPAEALGRVFDMFAQAHRAAGRGQGGLGIGLTMVRSLVEMHHGTVEAHSAGSGLGSEFVVRLPLAPPQEGWSEQAGAAEVCPHAALAGQRILVVDDNHDAADTLALLLESDGAEVRVAYDGRAALAAAEAFLPSTVLLDIGMPGMDGWEVARRLRQDERYSGMRIIALTGWGQDSDRRQTRNRGFSHHLTKPVSLEDLHQLLR